MDEALDALLDLDEGAVVGQRDDLADHLGADRVLVLDVFPRMRLELLVAKGDTFLLLVEVEHNHVDGLIQLDNFRRVIDAPPGKIGDMDEAVDTAQVHEHAEIRNGFDGSFQDLSLFQALDDRLALAGHLLFHQHLVADHNVLGGVVDLHHAKVHDPADEGIEIAHGAHIDLRAGKEGIDPQ